MKIFSVSEFDWYMSHSAEQARKEYIEIVGDCAYDLEEIEELSPEDMQRLKYCDEDGAVVTFQEEFNRRMNSDKENISSIFAMTDF